MKRRSIFSRIFIINTISVLICMVVLVSTETVLMTNYITKQSEDYLSKNVETIRNIIAEGINSDGLNNLLNGFAHATGSYIIVFDTQSRLISCSGKSKYLKEAPAFINGDYTKTVLSGQKNSMIGTMGEMFDETMFTLQIPIKQENGNTIGAISMSRPIPEHQKMKQDIMRILMFSIMLILILLFILTYFMSGNISASIRRISESTKEFVKGNFSVRVKTVENKAEIEEIAELTDAFNQMAAELEKSEEIKNAFISDVSHELRTPMTTIGGFVSGMLDDTIPQDKQKEYLRIVYDEIGRLSRLVNSFLDITRLQSDKLVIKKVSFDINELIRIVIIGLESKLESRGIEVELLLQDESCFVYADRDSIMRVITNLLDNAAKFTNDGGKISITVDPKQHDVRIAVRNTGDGIPEDQKQMIFKRFYKADKSRSLNPGGTGIGLYLVKNILSAHGKTIMVNSVEGEYAEFVFALDKGKHRRRGAEEEE